MYYIIMSLAVLPNEIDYKKTLPSLPDGITCTQVVVVPSSGQSFGPQQLITFDLPAMGSLSPSSMYLRYAYEIENATVSSTVKSEIKGTPFYSFFEKNEVTMGSTIVETLSNYGPTNHMITNLTLSGSQKESSVSYGYSPLALIGSVPNGRVCANNEKETLAGPFNCILSACERHVPLSLMPLTRIQLTTSSISSMFTTNSPPTNYKLTNVELVYDMITYPSDVTSQIMQNGPFFIKSQGLTNTGQTLPSGVSGSLELSFNQRFLSVKSLFTMFTGTGTHSLNTIYDSFDPTSSSGDFQYIISTVLYPSRSISMRNKKGLLMDLKHAIGGIHSQDTNNFSITKDEFEKQGDDDTTVEDSAKFYPSVNTEKISSNKTLLSGVSTNGLPIGLRINTSTPTPVAYTVNLITLYDILIEIDPMNRTVDVKK
jgi:hypothetical protein